MIFTDWHTDRSETFIFFNTVWSVRMAKKILSDYPRQSVAVNPRDWIGLLKIIDPGSSEVNVDLNVPIILIKWHGGFLPIDGWHRIKRALELGVLLPAVKLDRNESGMVRMP